MITVRGITVEQARAAFVDSIDDYLAFRVERCEDLEGPDHGKALSR